MGWRGSCARRSTWARGPWPWSAATPRRPLGGLASAGTRRRPEASSTPAPAGASSRTVRSRLPCSSGCDWRSRPAACGTNWRPTGSSSIASCCPGRPKPRSCCGSSTLLSERPRQPRCRPASRRWSGLACAGWMSRICSRGSGSAPTWRGDSWLHIDATAGRCTVSRISSSRHSTCWPANREFTPTGTTSGTCRRWPERAAWKASCSKPRSWPSSWAIQP
jgi:hypothetical protein